MRRAPNGPPRRCFGLSLVCLRERLGTRLPIVPVVCSALVAMSLTAAGWCGDPAASADVLAPALVQRSGYSKVYRYDSRLLADKPPYFSGAAARVTNYLFFTNFETVDPGIISEPSGCLGKYYSEWEGKYSCTQIGFLSGDRLEGPFHSNDAVLIDGSAEFGRAGADPPDVVEIYGGTYPEDRDGQCTGSPVFNTTTHCYAQGERIALPEGSTGLAKFVEGEDAFSGETRLELDGTTNTIRVVNFNSSGREYAKTIAWPRNGLIYVRSESCDWPTAPSSVTLHEDGPEEARSEKGCGTVYVRGTYSQPLTIAAQEDLVIDGSIYPTSVAGSLGSEPTGTAMLGLIAGDYVRIYHPVGTSYSELGDGRCNGWDLLNKATKLCEYMNSEGTCDAPNLAASEDPNGWGAQPDIWIYAAILAADHSLVVDNWACGTGLGDLNVYGSVAGNYRGIVGIAGSDSADAISAPPTTPPSSVCASQRHFVVHVDQLPGLVYRRVKVVLNGHRLATRITKRGVTAAVDLRGLPKGSYVLRITVETTHGRKITATRTYRTCAAMPIHPKRPSAL
jgi:hypothetical protein